MAPPTPRSSPPHPPWINLGTYNIQDGRGLGLHQAIQAVHLRNYDLMLLTETKITDEAYCHN